MEGISEKTAWRSLYATSKIPGNIRHDRLRPRPASHGAGTTLVRGFRARRAFRNPEPDPDVGRVRRVPDRKRRYPPDPLRRRILPRPRHARPAGTWFPDPGPHRAGRRPVPLHRGRIAGRLSRTVEPVLEAGLCRRHDLSRTRSDRTCARPQHRRGDIALDRLPPAPRTGAGRDAEIFDPKAAGLGIRSYEISHRASSDNPTPTTISTIMAAVG